MENKITYDQIKAAQQLLDEADVPSNNRILRITQEEYKKLEKQPYSIKWKNYRIEVVDEQNK